MACNRATKSGFAAEAQRKVRKRSFYLFLILSIFSPSLLKVPFLLFFLLIDNRIHFDPD